MSKVMTFIMDEGLILREYNQAKDKNEQVKILAELNDCTPDDIIEFLKENGAISGIKAKRQNAVKWTPELDAEVSRLAAEGLKQKEIAERLGISAQAIADRKRRLSRPIYGKGNTLEKEGKEATKTNVKKPKEAGVTSVMREIIEKLSSVGLNVTQCSINVLDRTFIITGGEADVQS